MTKSPISWFDKSQLMALLRKVMSPWPQSQGKLENFLILVTMPTKKDDYNSIQKIKREKCSNITG